MSSSGVYSDSEYFSSMIDSWFADSSKGLAMSALNKQDVNNKKVIAFFMTLPS